MWLTFAGSLQVTSVPLTFSYSNWFGFGGSLHRLCNYFLLPSRPPSPIRLFSISCPLLYTFIEWDTIKVSAIDCVGRPIKWSRGQAPACRTCRSRRCVSSIDHVCRVRGARDEWDPSTVKSVRFSSQAAAVVTADWDDCYIRMVNFEATRY